MRSTTRMRLEVLAKASGVLIRFHAVTERGKHVAKLGRRVDIAPHLGGTFVVHPAIGAMGFAVTDAASGCSVGFSPDSEADAISLAAANLAPRTDADMHQARERLRQMLVGS